MILTLIIGHFFEVFGSHQKNLVQGPFSLSLSLLFSHLCISTKRIFEIILMNFFPRTRFGYLEEWSTPPTLFSILSPLVLLTLSLPSFWYSPILFCHTYPSLSLSRLFFFLTYPLSSARFHFIFELLSTPPVFIWKINQNQTSHVMKVTVWNKNWFIKEILNLSKQSFETKPAKHMVKSGSYLEKKSLQSLGKQTHLSGKTKKKHTNKNIIVWWKSTTLVTRLKKGAVTWKKKSAKSEKTDSFVGKDKKNQTNKNIIVKKKNLMKVHNIGHKTEKVAVTWEKKSLQSLRKQTHLSGKTKKTHKKKPNWKG